MNKNRIFRAACAALMALLLSGCAGAPPAGSTASSSPGAPEADTTASSSSGAPAASPAVFPSDSALTITDSRGQTVTLSAKPDKVAALMGSYAQVWLLAGGALAGTTEDAVERGIDLPADTEVIGSVKEPNVERLLAMEPDLVLLSTDIESHTQVAETLEAAGIPCAFFRVETFKEYLDMLKCCTTLTGRADLYEENGERIAQRIEAVKGKASAADGHPTVLLIRALSTKAKALPEDNMVSLMAAELGADSITARQPSLLEELSMESILQEDPDYILAVPMGDTEKAKAALAASIEADPAWSSLSAVKSGRYIVLDKELFHYKPNNRWAESYETLYEILYSDDGQ